MCVCVWGGGYESLGTTALFGTSYFVILYSTLIKAAVVMNFAIQIKKTKKKQIPLDKVSG